MPDATITLTQNTIKIYSTQKLYYPKFQITY